MEAFRIIFHLKNEFSRSCQQRFDLLAYATGALHTLKTPRS